MPLERILRKWSKSDSLNAFLNDVQGELWARALDNKSFRRISGRLLRSRIRQENIFLVGCYNSGTTLLQKILLTHPKICGPNREGVRYTSAFSNLETNGHHMMWGEDWRSNATPYGGELGEVLQSIEADRRIFRTPEARYYLDKSIANTSRIEWLNKNLGPAKFIGIHRNGYCVCQSLLMRARPPEELRARTGSDKYPIELIADLWNQINTLMLDDLSSVPNSIMVSFEQLVSDPVRELEKVFDFLDLNCADIQFGKSRLIHFGQQTHIFDPNPQALRNLGPEMQEKIEPFIRETMTRLGYK